MTFFTLQYEQVNGQPREVSSVVMVVLTKRVRYRSSIAGNCTSVIDGTRISPVPVLARMPAVTL